MENVPFLVHSSARTDTNTTLDASEGFPVHIYNKKKTKKGVSTCYFVKVGDIRNTGNYSHQDSSIGD
jgi:hypothetical protein